MKELYEDLKVEVVAFEVEDIITISGEVKQKSRGDSCGSIDDY